MQQFGSLAGAVVSSVSIDRVNGVGRALGTAATQARAAADGMVAAGEVSWESPAAESFRRLLSSRAAAVRALAVRCDEAHARLAAHAQALASA